MTYRSKLRPNKARRRDHTTTAALLLSGVPAGGVIHKQALEYQVVTTVAVYLSP